MLSVFIPNLVAKDNSTSLVKKGEKISFQQLNCVYRQYFVLPDCLPNNLQSPKTIALLAVNKPLLNTFYYIDFYLECAQDLWTSFKRNMLRLFRKEVEEDSPTGDEDQSGTC